jgi:hypothetical protein
MVFNESEHFPELYNNVDYSYENVIKAQKINFLKFEYEMLHEDHEKAMYTLKTILRINESIKNIRHKLSDYITYVDLQNNTINVLQRYKQQFNEKENAIISIEVSDIDMTKEWKTIVESEFNYKL